MPLPIPLIWSGGEREHEVRADVPRECPVCGDTQPFTILEVRDEIGVWPLKNARWDVRYVTRCDTCGKRFKSSYKAESAE